MTSRVVSSVRLPSASNVLRLRDHHLGLVDREHVEEDEASGAGDTARAPCPSTPPLAPMMATGLPSKGGSGGREAQSIAFLSTPEIE